MPGIVGIIANIPRNQGVRKLQVMVNSLLHEKFYLSGTYEDESLGIFVGWTAREGSFSANMPVRNERGDVTLIFSGEEFPAPDTIDTLKQRGHEIGEAECSSYLVDLYEDNP